MNRETNDKTVAKLFIGAMIVYILLVIILKMS